MYVEYQIESGGSYPCKIFYRKNDTVVKGPTTSTPNSATADIVAYDPQSDKQRKAVATASGIVPEKLHWRNETGGLYEVNDVVRCVKFTARSQSLRARS